MENSHRSFIMSCKNMMFSWFKTTHLARQAKVFSLKYSGIVLHGSIGAFLGVMVLHPLTKLIYWLEIRGSLEGDAQSLKSLLLHHFQQALSYDAWPTTLAFALVGILISFTFAYYNRKLLIQSRTIASLENLLSLDVPSLILSGESETVEFKSSVRWDIRQGCINKELEAVITKSIAGFMNHRGGTLLIGVADNGNIIGIENDYKTIRHKNRDGFECLIANFVAVRLSQDCCTLIHCSFHTINEKEICRISIEPSTAPVYVEVGKTAHYFVRTGNATRELDAREAYAHILRH
ncbi:MAG: ATP-binding protein [Mariprofundaceae bacterium]|nr:ATP-binding protein [Mariprofundaceae bacterium]